jgi:hypothetical protein
MAHTCPVRQVVEWGQRLGTVMARMDGQGFIDSEDETLAHRCPRRQ